MKAKLVCYTLGAADHAKRSSFKRELFGYVDKSNYGKHMYERKGLLDKIPNVRPIRSIVIVKRADLAKVETVLKKYGAKYQVFDVLVMSF